MRDWRSPSALRIAACLAPSAERIWACFWPSAVLMDDSRWPSAVRIMARFSRSARICFSMESWMEGWRVDGLEFDAGHADAPAAGGVVQDAA